MANYDPNDPRRTDATDPHRPVDPAGRTTAVNETYVEPVEKKASPLPLIIGILLALALAWWLLSNFMGSDADTAGDTTTTITTPEPDTTTVPPVTTTEPAETVTPDADTTVPDTTVEEPVTPVPDAAPDAATEADAAATEAEAAATEAEAAADEAADAAADAEAAADTTDDTTIITPAN